MTDSQFPADSFPRQQARTRHFTLGRPRTFTVAEDGSRVAFLRSRASDDPVGCLWVFEWVRQRATGLRPAGSGEEHLSAEERDRRERRRETLTGVTDYAVDRAGRSRRSRWTVVSTSPTSCTAVRAVWTSTSRIRSIRGRIRPGSGSRTSPRGAPRRGRRRLERPRARLGPGPRRALGAGGVRRCRGDGASARLLVVAGRRADRGRSRRRAPRRHLAHRRSGRSGPPSRRGPLPGGRRRNAVVTLAIVDLDGGRVDVAWDRDAFPYLVNVVWSANGPLTCSSNRGTRRRGGSCGSIRPRARRRSCARTTTTDGSTSSSASRNLADGRLVRTSTRGHAPADVR